MNLPLTILAGGALAAVLATSRVSHGDLDSGLKPGDNTTPFNPMHVTGADRGSSTCPV